MKAQTILKLIVALVVITIVSSTFMSCGLLGRLFGGGDSESESESSSDVVTDDGEESEKSSDATTDAGDSESNGDEESASDEDTDSETESDGDVSDFENDSEEVTESETEEELRLDKDGYLMDDIPEDLKFSGAEIRVLGWKDTVCTEFNVTETSANAINNSIYLRERNLKKRFGITLNYTFENGGAKNVNNFKEKVALAIQSGGTDTYDIIASYTRSTAVCATEGYLLNLGDIQTDSYLDLSKPWWSEGLINATETIDGKIYFATGDASTSLAQMTYCVYFNADMVEAVGEDSPYVMVNNNEWTLEKMLNMSKGNRVDLGESGKDLDDEGLGVVGTYYDWPALLHGAGVGYITRDVTGEFILDPNLKGIGSTVMEMLTDHTTASGDSYVHPRDTSGSPISAFKQGRAMFIVAESGLAISELSQVSDFEYGCVPCPKYDTAQETYYSAVRQPITLFGILSTINEDRIPMVTAVLEGWGSQGYRVTTPAIFTKAMQGQSATSVHMKNMLKLIRDTAWFDCGRIYAVETNYICDAPGDALSGKFTWDGYVSQDLPYIEETLLPLLSSMLND